MRFRTLALPIATALAALVVLPVASGTAGASTPGDATVTVIHGIPNTPVDVYVNGADLLPNFQFKTVTPPLSLPPGSYKVAVRPAGAPAGSPPILAATETLTAGENATIIANLDAAGNPVLNAFANPTGRTPTGDATVIVRHTAAAPAVDVYAGPTRIISSLTNPNQASLNVPASTVPVSVTAAGAHTPVIGPVNLPLTAGHVLIAYAVGSLSAGTLTAVVQTYTVGQAKSGGGYLLASGDGGVFNFGSSTFAGSLGGTDGHATIVGTASTAGGKGYWLVGSDGGVFSFGDAPFEGSVPGLGLSIDNIVGIAATPDDQGYWLVGSDGGVFSFGDASFYGSMGGMRIARPIVGMSSTPDGGGYWLVGSDGGVFSFGDAAFAGSLGGTDLRAPVTGIASTPDGGGYWLVGSDGGVFSFGDAAFAGSLGASSASQPIVGIDSTPSGDGYWLVGSDGGVYPFGKAGSLGSLAGLSVHDVVGVSTS